MKLSVKFFYLFCYQYAYVFPCVAVNEKVSSFVLEMWFRWHQSLWMYCPVSVKVSIFILCCGLSAISNFVFIDELPFSCYSNCIQSFSSTAVYDIPVPDVLIQPVVTATVFQIL